MTLDELIEALQDLKKSGKEIGRLPVEFYRREKKNKTIDRVKSYSGGNNPYLERGRIELISLS